ncbi:hypothetical protein pb186bvf_014194 [Paramecium bursaria]
MIGFIINYRIQELSLSQYFMNFVKQTSSRKLSVNIDKLVIIVDIRKDVCTLSDVMKQLEQQLGSFIAPQILQRCKLHNYKNEQIKNDIDVTNFMQQSISIINLQITQCKALTILVKQPDATLILNFDQMALISRELLEKIENQVKLRICGQFLLIDYNVTLLGKEFTYQSFHECIQRQTNITLEFRKKSNIRIVYEGELIQQINSKQDDIINEIHNISVDQKGLLQHKQSVERQLDNIVKRIDGIEQKQQLQHQDFKLLLQRQKQETQLLNIQIMEGLYQKLDQQKQHQEQIAEQILQKLNGQIEDSFDQIVQNAMYSPTQQLFRKKIDQKPPKIQKNLEKEFLNFNSPKRLLPRQVSLQNLKEVRRQLSANKKSKDDDKSVPKRISALNEKIQFL